MSVWSAAVWLKNRLENYISENSEKWVYSGKTGTEKILINNEEWLEEELNLPAETDDYDNNAYIVGFFVPKVSGLHTITINADTLNANEDAILSVATFNELMHAVTNYNLNETDKIDAIDDIYGQFNIWDGSYSTRGIDRGKRLLRQYLGYQLFSSDTKELVRYCTKDEPVFLLAANNETADIDLWSAIVTVKYRETEAYE